MLEGTLHVNSVLFIKDSNCSNACVSHHNTIQLILPSLFQTFHNNVSLFIDPTSTVSHMMPEGAAGTLNIIALAIDNH